jgi:uncharacterized membrane protein YphA (DoxX/SURF4 family)
MATLIRIISRMLLSAIFIYGGYGAYSAPTPRTKRLPNVGLPESEMLVKINGATMMGAGAALALGIAPKLAALTLLSALIPTTAAGHAFWKETEGASRQQQQLQFAKNLGLVGALLLILSEPEKEKKAKAE